MKGKKLFALALVATMALPTEIASVSVSATVNDQNYAKTVLWSTSFEDSNGFKASTLDSRGTANVMPSMVSSDYAGDLTSLIDMNNLSGTSSYNSYETMSNLFDSDTSTKFLVSGSTMEIITKLKNNTKKTARYYKMSSANDAQERDPKTWTLQARNSDSDSWTVIDTRTDETFDSRYQTKTYTISNPGAYSQYRLYVTANYGSAGLSQLSDYLIYTGDDSDLNVDATGLEVGISNGPVSAWNQSASKGWTGSKCVLAAGRHVGTEKSYSYNVIYEGLNIPVTSNTNLSYVIFPSMSNGAYYDFEYTQMHMAVDLKFTDGTYLSNLGALDQNENKLDANSQGESRVLTTNQWNEIYSNIGSVANGKTIDKVLLVYAQDSHEDTELPNIQTYFDDIKIYNQNTPSYSHLSDYVNILRGTNNSANFSRGLTLPAVLTPQGFNFYAPCTEYASSEAYKYQSTNFKYMTISHEPSYWVGDRGTWQFMVNTSQNASSSSNYATKNLSASFSHDNEIAKPYYYSVAFDSNGGDAANSRMELTPTSHGAYVRFTYSNTSNRSVIFDCVNADGYLEYSGNTFKAYTDHTSNGSKRMYIYGVFSETPANTKVDSKNGIATFNSNTVTMKLATSYISYDQAKKNMELEIGSDSFDTVKEKAQSTWDDQLSIITDVKGATYEQLQTLYSCIYRMYMYPNLYSENTGTNESPVWKYKSPYQDDDADPVEGTLYINNGFWDTYRTAWAAYGLFTPSKETELLNGLVQHYKDSGWVPRWIAPGGTNSMVGTSSDVIFADAMSKGIDFDWESAYKSALKNAAVVSSNLTSGGRSQLAVSNFIGYAPGGGENFSWSTEGYINDYGIAQMAKILAQNETNAADKANYLSEYQYYLSRSKNYSKMFDNSGIDVTSKWLRGRDSSGSFTTGNYTNGVFDPLFWGSDYTETNAYNMSVSVPQDGVGIANLYGGADQLAAKLDTIFTTDAGYNGYNAVDGVGGIHEQKEAREVKLGQYGHSNQPSHHIPYMYLYSSTPWKTQYYVRDIMDRCYTGSSFCQGYIGDEDNGEMSAWYVLSAIGFYPLTMGSGQFAIGSPLFDEVTVNLEGGKSLVIKANNNSKENVYVDSLYVNGNEYDSNFISYETLENGGTIEFNMSATPNKTRGVSTESQAKSQTTGDNTPEAYVDFTGDADKSESTGVTTLDNLFDNSSDTETAIENTTTLMFSFTEQKAVRMLTLTSSASGRTPDKAQVYGDNGDENWTLLGEYSDNGSLFFNIWGKYTRPFAISSDKVANYSRYKVVLTGTNAYLAEVELLGYSDGGILKSQLGNAIATAKTLANSTNFTLINEKLDKAISQASETYNAAVSSDDEIKEAYQKITEMIDLDAKTVKVKDPSKIQAENFDDKSSAIVNDGNNIGGVKRNTWVEYQNVLFRDKATKIDINYAGKNTEAGGYAEIYLDNKLGEPIATVTLPTTGEYWADYTTVSAELNSTVQGLHNIYILFKNDNTKTYVANVDWIAFDTSSLDETYSDSLDIVGFQISYVNGGLRTISTVENKINGQEVVESGNVYALYDEAQASEVVVNSSNSRVFSFASTEKGILPTRFTESQTATDYAMTMVNNGSTAQAFNTKYLIRAYAKLADGTYVYSQVYQFTVYGVAKNLYDNRKMSTYAGHTYLYNNILSVVDSNYTAIDYDWGQSLAKF